MALLEPEECVNFIRFLNGSQIAYCNGDKDNVRLKYDSIENPYFDGNDPHSGSNAVHSPEAVENFIDSMNELTTAQAEWVVETCWNDTTNLRVGTPGNPTRIVRPT